MCSHHTYSTVYCKWKGKWQNSCLQAHLPCHKVWFASWFPLTGLTGRFCEINIDDCTDNPCGVLSFCKDGLNGYDCFCAPGFIGKCLKKKRKRKNGKRQENQPLTSKPLLFSPLCRNYKDITPFFSVSWAKIVALAKPSHSKAFIYSLLIRQISIILTSSLLPTMSFDNPPTTSFAPISLFPHH